MDHAPFDAYSPRQIAERLEALCVAKAATPLLSLVMLGILAGAFIGLGSLFYVIVASDPRASASPRSACSAAWCSRSG